MSDKLLNLFEIIVDFIFGKKGEYYEKIKKLILWLREKNEIWDYIIFGGIATILNFILFAVAIHAGIPTVESNTIASLISILFAYCTNKIWVFKTKDFAFSGIIKEMSAFFAGRLVTFVMETAILKLLIDILLFNSMYVKIATNVMVIVLNYIVSKKAVFRKTA